MRFINPIRITFFFCLISLGANAQLSVVSIVKDQHNKDQSKSKMDNLDPKPLPFWDDFSFNQNGFPSDTLWLNSQNVGISQGIGINPLSVFVANFNGTSADGRPYSTTDPLATGLTDSLVSRQILMTDVPLAQRNSVFISFYYQYQGLGEAPDPGDEFYLEFRNDQMQWERVWSVDGSINLSPDVFNPVILPVNQPRFFHNAFQFKFQSKGRQSGPFDTWNLDYVFLNSLRNSSDLSFPDRSIAAPLSSLFGDYWSIPLKHFIEDPQLLMQTPDFGLYNLKAGFSQPINYDTDVSITNIFEDESFNTNTYALETEAGIGGTLQNFERRMVSTQTLPDNSWFDADAKAIEITYKISVSTKDNVPPAELGDYEARYIPIDFRWNDTIRTTYRLADYYAYDDGEAEFAAGLNVAGGRAVYLFNVLGNEPDTIVSVDMHFPFVGTNESAQIDLIILRDLEEGPGSLLHLQTVNVERTGNSQFVNYKLSEPVGVNNTYYLGWRQRSSNRVDVGLDKNNDTGDRIYFNIGDSWQQNVNVKGSLMIRPRIGKGTGIITGIEKSSNTLNRAWPNPSSTGIFYLNGQFDKFEVLDQFGRYIPFQYHQTEERLTIDLSAQPKGMFFLRLVNKNRLEVVKLISH